MAPSKDRFKDSVTKPHYEKNDKGVYFATINRPVTDHDEVVRAANETSSKDASASKYVSYKDSDGKYNYAKNETLSCTKEEAKEAKRYVDKWDAKDQERRERNKERTFDDFVPPEKINKK